MTKGKNEKTSWKIQRSEKKCLVIESSEVKLKKKTKAENIIN